jgi:L-seryl-tRNA(Ser) seleniumtransferase
MSKVDMKILPSVDRVKQIPQIRALIGPWAEDRVTEAVRRVVERLRGVLRAGAGPHLPLKDGKVAPDFLAALAAAELHVMLSPSLVRVLNATGVVIHTNLGRAPLGPEIWRAMEKVATGYSNLEYNLDEGTRGSRFSHVERLMRLAVGAEATLVVNNNAAAVLLVLTALSRGKETIVSRSELIEIGGAFRLPEIMAQGGALLHEVGTTNRTKLADYERAVSERTGLLMKAHRSNFALSGFTEEVSRPELAALARSKGLPFFEDLGSGLLDEAGLPGLGETASVARALGEGADLVSFSGDKMLGGPQAGIVVGKEPLVRKLRAHPLTRALRPDKLTLAGLEATLLAYVNHREKEWVPVVRMLTEPAEAVALRAEAVATELAKLPGLAVRVTPCQSRVGGGAAPETALPSFGVRLDVEGWSETQLDEALRRGDPPLVARIEDGSVLMDLRTIAAGDLEGLVAAVKNIVAARSCSASLPG